MIGKEAFKKIVELQKKFDKKGAFMPNHVQNVLVFNSRESLEKVMNALKPGWKEEDSISFEWFAPYPKSKENCPKEYISEDSEAEHIQPNEEAPWLNWYIFQVNEWGTKWDAYEVEICNNEIWFQTAWSPPIPALKKLVDKLPEGVGIEYKYSEEQGALYCGKGYITNKNFDLSELDEYSDEAYQIANELWGEYYFKCEEDNEWHYEGESGTFLDDYSVLHYFDLGNPDKEKAVLFHKEFGKPFDDMIIEELEEDNFEFLQKAFGFVRVSESEYKFGIDNYVETFDEVEYAQSFSEEALDKLETA